MGAREGESKRERFERLAAGRSDKAVKHIRSFGKLSNAYFYEYTGEDAARFYEAAQGELAEACAKFGVEVECSWSISGNGCDASGTARGGGRRGR